MQQEAKKQIKLYGGDRKKFIQNGGHELLGGYVNQVVGSEEMQRYKENKENLVRIMDAQEKGMGGMLLERDIQAMQRYQQTGEGSITYGGLLSQIDLPDSDNYDLGQDIPLEDIMRHENNYMKILSNYKMYYPNSPDPTPEQLTAFADNMGYAGRGSNREAIDFARKMALKTQKAQQNSKEKAVKDSRKSSYSAMGQQMLAMAPKNKTAKELAGNLDELENTNWFAANKDNPAIRNYGIEDWDVMGEMRNLDNAGWDLHNLGVNWFSDMTNPQVKLAHSNRIFKYNTNEIAKRALQKEISPDGTLEMMPDTSMFDSKGQKMAGKNALEFDEYQGKYTVMGITTAMKGKEGKNQRDQLMINLYDGDELDKTKTLEFNEGMGDSTMQPTTVIALQDDDGNVFYKEFNIFEKNTAAQLQGALGDAEDLTSQEEGQQKLADTAQAARQRTDAEYQAIRGGLEAVDSYANSNEYFQQEAYEFADNEDSNLNRSALLKAFYDLQGVDAMNNSLFTQFASNGGTEAYEVLKDFSLSDAQAITKFINLSSRYDTPEVQKNNQDLLQEILFKLEDYNKLYNE